MSRGASEAGFYGKVPTHGDFVSQRLPRTFLDHWDAWMAEAVQTSRSLMDSAWLPAYLSAPLWRFVLGPRLCGPTPMMGVVMPSVDRVGRYYPLTIAVALPERATPALAFAAYADWFAGAVAQALSALEDDFDLDAFDAGIKTLQLPATARQSVHISSSNTGFRAAAPGVSGPDELCPAVLDGVINRFLSPYSLWSTTEPEPAATALMVCSGLPDPATFPAFLDGQWQRWGWAAD